MSWWQWGIAVASVVFLVILLAAALLNSSIPSPEDDTDHVELP